MILLKNLPENHNDPILTGLQSALFLRCDSILLLAFLYFLQAVTVLSAAFVRDTDYISMRVRTTTYCICRRTWHREKSTILQR